MHETPDRPARPRSRTAREEALLDEVRWRLSHSDGLAARLRRLDRMERAARIWVNGEELSARGTNTHLSAAHD